MAELALMMEDIFIIVEDMEGGSPWLAVVVFVTFVTFIFLFAVDLGIVNVFVLELLNVGILEVPP